MKPAHRVADTKMPGSFSIQGLHYVQILISMEYSTGKFQVIVGNLKSPSFFTKEQAEREFNRITAGSVVKLEDLSGYNE